MDGEYYNENQYGTPYTKSSKEENDFLVNELVENPNSQTYQNNDAYQEIKKAMGLDFLLLRHLQSLWAAIWKLLLMATSLRQVFLTQIK